MSPTYRGGANPHFSGRGYHPHGGDKKGLLFVLESDWLDDQGHPIRKGDFFLYFLYYTKAKSDRKVA